MGFVVITQEYYKLILNVSDTLELEEFILVLPKLPASNRRWSMPRLEFS